MENQVAGILNLKKVSTIWWDLEGLWKVEMATYVVSTAAFNEMT